MIDLIDLLERVLANSSRVYLSIRCEKQRLMTFEDLILAGRMLKPEVLDVEVDSLHKLCNRIHGLALVTSTRCAFSIWLRRAGQADLNSMDIVEECQMWLPCLRREGAHSHIERLKLVYITDRDLWRYSCSTGRRNTILQRDIQAPNTLQHSEAVCTRVIHSTSFDWTVPKGSSHQKHNIAKCFPIGRVHLAGFIELY